MRTRRVLPQYNGGSIVNLMSSLEKGLKGKKSLHSSLRALSAKEILENKNIVLMVIDGMGSKLLDSIGKDSSIARYKRDTITSVFPSTTAAAVTTLATGLSPSQHGLVGWHLYLREFGTAAVVLPYIPRYHGGSLNDAHVPSDTIFDQKSFSDRVSAESFLVMEQKLLKDSVYTDTIYGKSKHVGYSTLKSFFRQTQKVIKSSRKRKYIHAYWSKFDYLQHIYGPNSKEVLDHFWEIDREFAHFVESIQGTDTMVVLVADHGLVSVPDSGFMNIKQYPALRETLSIPLCGDARIPYFYVRPSREKVFKSQVKKILGKKGELVKGEKLIKKGLFGPGKPHKELFHRVGDYVLLLEPGYILKDFVCGEKEYVARASHGGLSEEEMLVPLVIAKG